MTLPISTPDPGARRRLSGTWRNSSSRTAALCLRRRVRERSYQKFGDRVLPGGDLYETEQNWYALTDSRPDDYVTRWLDTVQCPVIRIDGTLPVKENLGKLLTLLA